ncbi:MAG: hypothetical protein QOE31_2009 [Solirubrobacteraceae bacterium]|nr:hypothetical protein [Solirubrobacteraceae bacterium]
MSSAGNAALAAARRRLALRRAPATTPWRLRLAAALLALSAIVFGVVTAQAVSTRRDAVRNAVTTEGRLVKAVELSATLSDAHATAAYSFLVGGPEPARTRLEYIGARNAAAARVAQLAAEVGSSPRGTPEVLRITQKLPEYTGLIDSARANFRHGYPLGSAYLRRASTTLRDEMLPSAVRLYEIEADNLTSSYRSGASRWTVLIVALTACAMLALLAATQVYVARVTRRIVNVRMALASAIMLALTAWIVVAFSLQSSALVQAERRGSDAVELITATRILASRAQALESIALSARGGGTGEPRLSEVDRAFQVVSAPIPELLQQLDEIPGRSTASIDRAYRRYLRAHELVVAQQSLGQFTEAVNLAVGAPSSPGSTTGAADVLDRALGAQATAAQQAFEDDAARAGSRLAGLPGGLPLLTALGALLALSGVRQRLEEYR